MQSNNEKTAFQNKNFKKWKIEQYYVAASSKLVENCQNTN